MDGEGWRGLLRVCGPSEVVRHLLGLHFTLPTQGDATEAFPLLTSARRGILIPGTTLTQSTMMLQHWPFKTGCASPPTVSLAIKTIRPPMEVCLKDGLEHTSIACSMPRRTCPPHVRRHRSQANYSFFTTTRSNGTGFLHRKLGIAGHWGGLPRYYIQIRSLV